VRYGPIMKFNALLINNL